MHLSQDNVGINLTQAPKYGRLLTQVCHEPNLKLILHTKVGVWSWSIIYKNKNNTALCVHDR